MTEFEKLAESAKRGDAHSFSKLYESVYKEMYKVAFYSLGNKEDAADCVMDAVTDAFAGIKKLKDPGAFKTWIFKILSAKIAQKKKEYVNKSVNIEDIPESEDEKASLLQEDHTIRSLFFSLPEEDRTILALNIFMGYGSEEISEILGIPAGTVRSRKKRSLDKLRNELSR